MANSPVIPFRLRAKKDEDIKTALKSEVEITKEDRSDIIRKALRFYFKHKETIEENEKEIINTTIDSTVLVGIELEKDEKRTEDLEDALDGLLGGL